MRNTIRCCISCILPCGSLDVIRIVHANGRVEEISGTIRAEEVMKAHPKHVLKKPTTWPTSDVDSPRGPTIVVVPPDAQLQRGKIYFLIPVHHDHQSSSSSAKKKSMSSSSSRKSLPNSSSSPSIGSGGSSSSTARRRRREHIKSNSISLAAANLMLSSSDGDKYLSDILNEKVISSHRDKRRGRVAVWRPHLESITETLSEAASSDQ